MNQEIDSKFLKLLQDKVHAYPHNDYSIHSRVHPLQGFGSNTPAACFVKRDDELGFGISGNKLRKYRTLIPSLIHQECQEAIILGGAFSNNVLALTQLLIENNIVPTLFLRGSEPTFKKGNFLLLQMLLPSSSMHWIPRSLWFERDAFLSAYTHNRHNYVIIPEGATLFSAFPGALTLPLDIIQNEQSLNCTFQHIFIDVGTGFSAAALLLGFAFLRKTTVCHLLLLAEDEKEFLMTLRELHKKFEEWIGEKCPFPTHFSCLKSTLAPSFGSTNSYLFSFLVEVARSNGLFLDPIYSGKLFHQAKSILEEENSLEGNTLIIHSGGALTLAGFQDPIEKAIQTKGKSL